MKFFFSCDWGTSTFRVYLVNLENGKVLSTITTDHGIASIFNRWSQAGQPEMNRLQFYQQYLFEQVTKIASSFNTSLEGIPIILSGMASSTIGMLELPYKELPFACDGSDLIRQTFQAEEHRNEIILISGARCENDVIRGEETLLAGCKIAKDNKQQLFILPGTHSKHILVNDGVVENITTYITGELFDLLSKKSLLALSVNKNSVEEDVSDRHFIEGVIKGSTLNLLNAVFHVRTNALFNKKTPGENYRYLSGLLIGSELKHLAEGKIEWITLVCGEGFRQAYTRAMNAVGITQELHYINADEALVNGHLNLMQQHSHGSRMI